MNLLFDTNIIIYIVRALDSKGILNLKNPGFETYPFSTPRNMGKNDLWIASLAAVLGLQLITTDSDFDHLNEVFFDVRKIAHQEFLPFFKK